MRAVAAQYGVSLATVQRWVTRAGDQRLDRVDWSESRGGRRTVQATSPAVEDLVLQLRRELRDRSDLGEFGAAAIHRSLLEQQQVLGIAAVPAVRTIGRILERRGALDGRRRVRRPAPPRGWYLADVAAGLAELDSFDIVEGLVIKGGTDVEVLNGVSLHGGLCGSWVDSGWTAKRTVESLLSHWTEHGFPDYVQFDNDTVFQGAHQWPDSFGRVTRTSLQLGVTVVFAPPRETGFQASIEAYNGRWQEKVWSRFQHQSLADVRQRSDRFVAAPAAIGQPHRSRPHALATAVRLAPRLLAATVRDSHLPATHRRSRSRVAPGTRLRRERDLVPSTRPLRGGPHRRPDPDLPAPPPRTEPAAVAQKLPL